MEVKEGSIKRDVHNCLLPKGVPPNRFFVGTDIGAGKEVHDIAWLTTPHGSVKGWFPSTWGNPCVQVSCWGLSFEGHTCLNFSVNVSGEVLGVSRMFRVIY